MIILGGMGNIYGVIVGGLIVGGFDRMLADLISDTLKGIGRAFDLGLLREADVSHSRSMILGLALVTMMLMRPEGLLPSARRRMELHAADESAEEAAAQRESLSETQR